GVLALELAYAVTWLRERFPQAGGETLWYALRWLAMLPALLLSSRLEWWALAGLPLVCLYRGEKGRQPSRWFFYAFYPAHLLLLALLRSVLFGA
ncbi:MAG: hypothetical protein IJ594_00440, partial [Oscillospiraceae bacterium]|nr:hypothetical protein [Oscillospiraceae bacterium]